MLFHSSARAPGYPGFSDRSGQRVEVLRPLADHEYDRSEVGQMFRVRFLDGAEADVFEDELQPEGAEPCSHSS